MQITQLTPALAVSSQIRPGDLAEIAARGFRTLVNNRPDGEEPGQPTNLELREAAERAGLTYHHIPVVAGQMSDEDAAAFGRIVNSHQTPVLAFCRSGHRSRVLWERSQRHHP